MLIAERCKKKKINKKNNKKQGCIQDKRCDCNMLMWNAGEIKDFHNLSP